MLHTLLMIVTAQAAAQCEFPLPPSAAAVAISPAADEYSAARPGLHTLRRDRINQRRNRDVRSIDRTLARFFRSLRHRLAERRAHRSPGLFRRLRDRRGDRHAPADDVGAPGQVSVPHEDPVDLPLYPQPRQ